MHRRRAKSNFSRVRVIEKRALQSEAMDLCLGAARKPICWSERLWKNAGGEPRPKMVYRLFVSVSGFSELASRSTQCQRFPSDREKTGLKVFPSLHAKPGEKLKKAGRGKFFIDKMPDCF
jgi:hypothetical protein